jgi:hypothetical protein
MGSEFLANRAWLHRRQRPTWMFEPNAKYGELIHRTGKGTVYAILADHKHGKPFWVARLHVDEGGRQSWFTVEARLRSRSIEFEDAGTYTFPT